MLEFLSMLIAGLYVITSVAGLKTVAFGPFVIAAGGLFIGVVKPLIDVINEVWGPAVARATVLRMSVVRAIVYAGMAGLTLLPAVHEPPGFGGILRGSVWLFCFGVIAELVASVVIDIPIFTWLKKRTRLGFLIRQYGSNVSLVIQSLVFTTLYSLLFPHVEWARFFAGQFLVLLVVSSILAPVAALIVRRIRE